MLGIYYIREEQGLLFGSWNKESLTQETLSIVVMEQQFSMEHKVSL